ncbi:hypothetical protein CAL7716_102170 (plasmid) [Calothrix sp. PCC 7716]|nr:hypothetical protein CAL7716_102170 [Calothrix sp. PCC 7716]
MSQASIITPIDGTNFPLVGNAVTYAFRKFIASKQNNQSWLNNTLAGNVLSRTNLTNLSKICYEVSKLPEEEAFKMLLLGAFETYYRNYKTDIIIQPFLNGAGYKLGVSTDYISQWRPSIDDVSNISATLPTIWCAIEHLVSIEKPVISNATFSLSNTLHADCQMIMDSSIVDIRTSAKKQPFTLENFYQQLSYLLFDSNNEYKIEQLIWVYTRQKTTFSYRVEELFKNINATRAEFKEMILQNYHRSRIKKLVSSAKQ